MRMPTMPLVTVKPSSVTLWAPETMSTVALVTPLVPLSTAFDEPQTTIGALLLPDLPSVNDPP